MTGRELGAPDEELDRWLTDLLVAAAPGRCSDFAIVALGSFGRHERCAYSDLDVLLLHDDQPDVADVADALWYPIWDAGFRLDHSVRTVKESIAVAAADLRAAVGLLDARLVVGSERLHRELVDRVRRTWEHRAPQWLPALAAAIAERHRQAGAGAFLLEPDLTEG